MDGKIRWYKQGQALLDEIRGSKPNPNSAHIWFLGQHGFALNLGGETLYFDVILNDFLDAQGKSRRCFDAPFGPQEPQKADYVFCTHDHSDHLNLETLIPLAKACPKARFIVPNPSRDKLIRAGIDESRVIGAKAGEKTSLGGIVVHPVAAVHTRFIQDEAEQDANGDCTSLGFVIEADGLKIYHPGDTWVTTALVETLKALGPLDIAMLPINGTDWMRTAEDCIGNMSAIDSVKLAMAIPIDLVIPTHYNMFSNNSENPALFADYMYRLCPWKRFHISALGEKFIYEKG
ncbi:MBL fold metallo-hydrolase [Leadbettera azotonutricia]|uniref:Metallo-beta-lactamase domain-containing protein n=1 Tax=Leadbettera azotonutricia (strain ATCC BAA-888 / DSM 13862 / ZAS-9) TaxID=545695 RepID=F5YCC7_LEAAZ|nr:MBL fold metallo-hydrolase [Leadbettera azotonutricia]AEF82269.1 conserved hypothetical protein [Leadbettera azotonutricia ZAS-9]